MNRNMSEAGAGGIKSALNKGNMKGCECLIKRQYFGSYGQEEYLDERELVANICSGRTQGAD